MRIFKKLAPALLALALAVLCLVAFSTEASAATSGTCGENVTWTLDDNGTLTISGSGPMTNLDYSTNDWKDEDVKSIVVKSGVTTIGDYAFYNCYKATSVSLPNGITYIGERAFWNCSDLTSIKLPSGVTYIGERAFAYCDAFTSFVIPATVTEIADSAFLSCYNLVSITIPANVSSIGKFAFNGCSDLTAIYVDSKNAYFSHDNRGVLFNKNKSTLLQAPGAISGHYTIPSTVTTLQESAFESCYSLTSITIPNSVKTIEDSVFEGCYKLTSISIPASVTSIGMNAFRSCSGVKGFNVAAKNTVYSSDNWGVIFDKTKTILLLAPPAISGTYNVPSGVEAIADYAFYNCASLTGINFPYTLKTIGEGALSNTAITSATIPDNVTTMKADAFYGCDYMKSVTIGTGITVIPSGAFGSCDVLTTVKIPGTVVSIGSGAFSYTPITSIDIPVSVTEIKYSAFDSCKNLKTVHYNGTTSQKAVISIDNYNDPIKNATWHCMNVQSASTANGRTSYRCNCGYNYYMNAKSRFPDVTGGSWYFDAVGYAVDKGYFTGHGNGTFGPSDGITRQDFVVVLARISGADLNKYSGVTKFTDVSSKAYYAKAIHWASSTGVVMGYNDTKFGVGDTITREQLVTILYRYAASKGYGTQVSANAAAKLNAFGDAKKVNQYMRTACIWALDKGVLGGKNPTTFDPQGHATRAQVATILKNISTNNIMPI